METTEEGLDIAYTSYFNCMTINDILTIFFHMVKYTVVEKFMRSGAWHRTAEDWPEPDHAWPNRKWPLGLWWKLYIPLLITYFSIKNKQILLCLYLFHACTNVHVIEDTLQKLWYFIINIETLTYLDFVSHICLILWNKVGVIMEQ